MNLSHLFSTPKSRREALEAAERKQAIREWAEAKGALNAAVQRGDKRRIGELKPRVQAAVHKCLALGA